MASAITQRKAKVLIRDYLRETGRKGVTSLMRDIQRHTGSPIFAQRTFEKWLEEQDRTLQDENWEIVQDFVSSVGFRAIVPCAAESPLEARLRTVAEGYVALYEASRQVKDVAVLPSVINRRGIDAAAQLDGHWENNPNPAEGDVPRVICKIEPVPDSRFAKFAYVALFRSQQISTTGLIIYLGSEDIEGHDYCHIFVLQLWRRRDPESASTMPGELIYITAANNQPELSISKEINSYFYKAEHPIASRGRVDYAVTPADSAAEQVISNEPSAEKTFRWSFNAAAGNKVVLSRVRNPIPEEKIIIDQLVEDVLPHGLT